MPKSYTCEKCLFSTHIKYHYTRHLGTNKHIRNEQRTEPVVPVVPVVTVDALLKENHLLKMENAGLRIAISGWNDYYASQKKKN